MGMPQHYRKQKPTPYDRTTSDSHSRLSAVEYLEQLRRSRKRRLIWFGVLLAAGSAALGFQYSAAYGIELGYTWYGVGLGLLLLVIGILF